MTITGGPIPPSGNRIVLGGGYFMLTIWISLGLMLVAFLVTMLVYPYVLTFARKHKIVDNPNARKLQRVPVPVMGGTTVFIGLLVSVFLAYIIAPDSRAVPIMVLLFVMYAIGVWDDIKDVSAALRFIVESVVVWLMIFLLGVEINDFHGLWGIHELPDMVSVPLSLVAGVGIMNAINLIDGVDGYCSTYGMMACIVFAIIFYRAGDMGMFTLALIGIGALLPFFFHNVFGKTSKMFLGDGGSLMLGTLLTLFAFSTLSSNSPCADFGDKGICLPALVLAVLAVPVFDTLKVMIMRVAKGQSPFHPDKTHLHHLYIEMNYSHLATSSHIVFWNACIICILILSWYLGLSIDGQMYLVIFLSAFYTWGFYFFMEYQHRMNDGEGSELWKRVCNHAKKTNLSEKKFWQLIRRAVDSRFLGGKPVEKEPVPGPQVSSRPDPRIK